MTAPVHLHELRISNFCRISAAAIRPNGSLVTITGKNGQGKTSILTALWVLLKGKAAGVPRPIRDGAEECTIKGDFGEFTVTRHFGRTEDGELTTKLLIMLADGTPVSKKPQGFLDSLFDGVLEDLVFRPLEFIRWDAKKQYDTLRGLVKFDFDGNKADYDRIYATRTGVNSKRDAQLAQASGIKLPPGPAPARVDIAQKVAELSAANRHNADRANSGEQRAVWETAIAAKRARVIELRRQADDLEQQADDDQERFDQLLPLPDLKDVGDIEEVIAGATAVNRTADLHEQRATYEKAAAAYEAESKRLTTELGRLKQEKMDAVATADLPIKGLSFGDDEILFDDLPLAQVNTARRIQITVGLAMALKPRLKIMTLDEASELDIESLAELERLAAAHDFCVLCARVSNGGGGGLEIVDGHLT